ncbi:MAG TPA: hypothetical protein VFR72_06205, partial [Gemmatimonadales bacterium]|nr:hypothetical protein [Gemmatimonadales bacterium]
MRRQPAGRAAPGSATLTGPDPRIAFDRTREALGSRYHLERIVASSAERVLFEGRDEVLKRRVSIRINFYVDDAIRAWFMRESEALGRLDDPGILHVYDAGQFGDLAYRVGNWVEGEGLREAVQRGPRPIPMVLALARDLLGAL